MAERSLIFPAEEFRSRTQRLQDQMRAQSLGALLLTTPQDVFYVTGFLTRFWESPARPWFVIVPASGAPVAVIPSIGAPLMGRTWVSDIRTWDAPHPVDDGISLLTETLQALLPQDADIGVPMALETHLRMPLADYHRLSAALAPRRIVDGTAAVHRIREIKTPAEIAKIRHTCAIAARAFDRVPEIASAGTPLDTVFRRFQSLLLEEGADWVSYVAGAAGQMGYADVISPAAPTPLRSGDVLMLDTGAVCDGYFCDYDRNYFVGQPSAALQRTQDALWQATEHALDRLRPGMQARDAHRILVEGLERHGAAAGAGRLGHGLGTSLTEWPSFTPHDTTELRAGMVLTLEPGAHVTDDHILVHEENIVLRDTGAELLSPRAPQGGMML
ncbi:Xaa-Pro peptidase family protein [uncultured Tateyamaria sp.]|uniref:M24 family metallopeptidase n=1 Tax=Tateyamaria sp. 1078 TaxID=3417464 RepID=UPI002610659C|nr:Xaa-Pro peptidase family protein [uncultured Tateyamaria sp.]